MNGADLSHLLQQEGLRKKVSFQQLFYEMVALMYYNRLSGEPSSPLTHSVAH